MKPEPAAWDELETQHDRACARLAMIARLDTIIGSCKALMLSGRSGYKNFPSGQIVSDVYGASTGKHHPEWEAWECEECGYARLGKHEAAKCCVEDNDETD